jgi:hypothetical protein
MRPLSIEIKEYKGKTCLLVELEPNKIFGLYLEPKIIDIADFMLKTWGEKVFNFFDEYDENRMRMCFLVDFERLALYIQNLSDIKDIRSLVDASNYTQLFHNRHLAQLMVDYRSEGNSVDLEVAIPSHHRRHDFNVNDISCEVKTIQSLACFDLRHHWLGFEEESLKRLFQNLKTVVANAIDQVGNDGIVFIAFLGLETNFILHEYFGSISPKQIPPPRKANLILKSYIAAGPPTGESERYFSFPLSTYNKDLEDLYTFLLKRRLMILENVFSIPVVPPMGKNVFIRPCTEYYDTGIKFNAKFRD